MSRLATTTTNHLEYQFLVPAYIVTHGAFVHSSVNPLLHKILDLYKLKVPVDVNS